VVIGHVFLDQSVETVDLLIFLADGLLYFEDDVSLLLDVGEFQLFELELVKHFLLGRHFEVLSIFCSIIHHYKTYKR
jgi:hypothetical protein